VYFCARSGGHF
nr:immunoglobulin heavy chain junction region [Mus musculus]